MNELRGLKFEHSRPGDAATGEQILERLSFPTGSDGRPPLRRSVAAQAKLLAANYLAAYLILCLKRPAYQPLLRPSGRL